MGGVARRPNNAVPRVRGPRRDRDWAKSGTATVDATGANRFAFVLHPLTVDYLAHHPHYRWTRHLPAPGRGDRRAHAGRVRRARRRAACRRPRANRSTGFIYALGATPRQMLTRPPEFTYRRLDQAVRDAAGAGAQIVGLGAFTKVVGDAGITVARRASDTGHHRQQPHDRRDARDRQAHGAADGLDRLSHAKAMIVGATGSIGSVCSRLLAAAVHDVVLVSIEPERLVALKQQILAETPGARSRSTPRRSAMGRRLRPHRHGDVCVRPARARRQPVQARRGYPRRGVAAGHLGGGSGNAARRARRRERRGADSRARGIQLQHRPAAGSRLRVPRGSGTARDGGALRMLHARARHAARRRSRRSTACSASTASRSRRCALSASR